MPYILQERRRELTCGRAPRSYAKTKGELNFMFTVLAKEYLDNHGLCYDSINDIMGAFEAALAEFYRRVAVPYEDKKIAENGDVY
jgi:hypothetical protein